MRIGRVNLARIAYAYTSALFLIVYIAFNSVIRDIKTVHELTKWTWLVWTVTDTLIAIMLNKKILKMQSMNGCVMIVLTAAASLGAVVAVGVSILFFYKALLIKGSIATYGVLLVFAGNFLEHFYPPIHHMILTGLFSDVFYACWKKSELSVYFIGVVSSLFSFLFVVFYLIMMNVKEIYKVNLDASAYIMPLLFTTCAGSAAILYHFSLYAWRRGNIY